MANLSHLLGNLYDEEDPAPADDADAADAQADDVRADDVRADEVGNDPQLDEPRYERDDATEAAGAPPRHTPDWASDERLDAAFGDWTAGEMPEMERDRKEDLAPEPAAEAPAPLEAASPAPPVETVEAVEAVEAAPSTEVARPAGTTDEARPQHTSAAPERSAPEATDPPPDDQLAGPTWELSHDDVLPSRSGGLLQLLRRS